MPRSLKTPLYTLLCTLFLSALASAQNFKRVVIDPGHGGKDKGAIWGGVRESDLNLKVARKVETLLKAHGIPCTMTRRSDSFISLSRRAELSNRYRDAIFVSIHFNACMHKSVHGVETYYASYKGRKLAGAIQSQMVKKLGLKNRNTRLGGQYAVLNQTKDTAVLVECGYISNYSERQKCKRSWFHSLAASAIVDGILKYR